MKTFGIFAVAIAAIGATVYANRDKLKPLYDKVKPAIDQFAAGRPETTSA